MSNYTKTVNFLAKDALSTGDPNKVIKGSEHDTEFDNLETASATKSNKVTSAVAGNVIEQSASGDLVDSGYSFSGLVGDLAITKAEFDVLDGATNLTTADLIKVADTTSSAAEINLLDGVAGLVQADFTKLAALTATAAQLNSIASTTSSSAELDKLDGATLTTTELNYVDGVTSAIQTQFNNLGTLSTQDTITSSQIVDYAAGSTYTLASSDAVSSNSASGTDFLAKTVTVHVIGTLDCYWQAKITGAGSVVSWVTVNGATIATYTHTGGYTAHNDTLTVGRGDVINLYVKPTNNSNTAEVQLFKLRATTSNVPFSAVTSN